VRRLHTGVYVCAHSTLTLGSQVKAALLALPEGTAASHVTGLQVRGIDVGARTPLHFTSSHHRQVRVPGVRVHRRSHMPQAANGLLSPERCFVDAAAELGLVAAVAAGDWLLHARLSSEERLASEIDACAGVQGVAAARAALPFVRPRVESPRETLVRLLLVLAGLPEPLTNVAIGTGADFLARGDLVYPEFKLIVEYDGRQHAEDAYQWNRDLDRLDALSDAGWRVVRVTAKRLRQPREVVLKVHRQLVAAGYRGPAPQFDAAWKRLFES